MKNKINGNVAETYVSEKLIYAAYLIAADKAKLIGTKPIGNGKIAFILSRVPTNEEMAGFFGGTATVPALKYAETMTNLKSVAHEMKSVK